MFALFIYQYPSTTHGQNYSAIEFLKKFTGKAFLENCFVSRNVNSPTLDVSQKTNLTLSFYTERFLHIDDVTESFTLLGSLTVSWQVPCVHDYANSVGWPHFLDRLVHEDVNEFWTPSLTHINSMEDSFMQGSQIGKLITIFPLTGIFWYHYIGSFKSFCDQDFYKFPFDT